jgi:hypothetical protein
MLSMATSVSSQVRSWTSAPSHLQSRSDTPRASSHPHRRLNQGPNPRACRQGGRTGRGVDGGGGTPGGVDDPPSRRSPTSQSRRFTRTFIDSQKQDLGLRRAQKRCPLRSIARPRRPQISQRAPRSMWRRGCPSSRRSRSWSCSPPGGRLALIRS